MFETADRSSCQVSIANVSPPVKALHCDSSLEKTGGEDSHRGEPTTLQAIQYIILVKFSAINIDSH